MIFHHAQRTDLDKEHVVAPKAVPKTDKWLSWPLWILLLQPFIEKINPQWEFY